MRFALAALAALALAPMSALATEEPDHTVVVQEDRFQIRAYEPMILAEVTVEGDLGQASNRGFRALADYIFGNNLASTKIDMTAPVLREPSPQKIDMTAPVLREANPAGDWTVTFVMPSQWTMETLPVPNNPDVTIREVTGQVLAAAEFRGSGSSRNFARWEGELVAWLGRAGYEVTGAPRYAGYSGPWVPSPMKRQEVLIPVVEISSEDS
ncbi:MAG: heme-binding protein [Pseudomonadota bacterium]